MQKYAPSPQALQKYDTNQRKYHKVIKTNRNISKITKSKVEWPLILGAVDEHEKYFVIVLQKMSSVVSRVVAVAIANCKSLNIL